MILVGLGGTILRLLLLHFGLFLVVDVNFAPRDAKFYIHLHNSLWVRLPWMPLLSDVAGLCHNCSLLVSGD